MSSEATNSKSPGYLPPSGILFGFVVFVLALLGLVVLFSSSHSVHGEPSNLLLKQTLWLGIAVLGGMVAMRVDLQAVRPYSYVLGGFSVVLLGLVLIPGIGVEVNGARRWIDFGVMRLQVSEVGKVGLLFVMAHYLATNRRRMHEFVRGFFIPCCILSVFCGLIFGEPDYGTAFLCGLVGGALLFLAGARLKFLLPATALALGLFALAVYHNPERLERVTAFLDVEGNRSDASFQLWQGILAFGSGGVNGVGLGSGRQQLDFLPEANTDFIFAILGEELGLIFTAGVVLLFGTIFFLGLLHLRRASNPFEYLLVVGALLLITFQALINMGVVTGTLPTKGISLPFISYGGSNLLLMFVLAGIILNGMRSWENTPYRKRRIG